MLLLFIKVIFSSFYKVDTVRNPIFIYNNINSYLSLFKVNIYKYTRTLISIITIFECCEKVE
jgi:hypothetical protein